MLINATFALPIPAPDELTVPLIPAGCVCVTVNLGCICVLAPPLPDMVITGLYVPAGSPAFGRIVKVLDCPGVISVVQFAPGANVQLGTDGSEFSLTFTFPVFITVIVCAAGCAYPTGKLPKFGSVGNAAIEVVPAVRFKVTSATLLV